MYSPTKVCMLPQWGSVSGEKPRLRGHRSTGRKPLGLIPLRDLHAHPSLLSLRRRCGAGGTAR